MTIEIYMVCGVPGSGKTWVCNQLIDKFKYLSHDLYKDKLVDECVKARLDMIKHGTTKHILIDCPFGERKLRESLEKLNFKVKPVFIIEDANIVKQRYEKRENKPFPNAQYARCSTIINRAKEWNTPNGKSEFILKYLKNI
jgi:gluconate kinase